MTLNRQTDITNINIINTNNTNTKWLKENI